MLLDHDGYLPVYAHVTEGNVPEIEIARALNLEKARMPRENMLETQTIRIRKVSRKVSPPRDKARHATRPLSYRAVRGVCLEPTHVIVRRSKHSSARNRLRAKNSLKGKSSLLATQCRSKSQRTIDMLGVSGHRRSRICNVISGIIHCPKRNGNDTCGESG